MKKRYAYRKKFTRKDGVLNRIISNELNFFAQELHYFSSPVILQDIAKQVGFVEVLVEYLVSLLSSLI